METNLEPIEQKIRESAYLKWEAAGYPENRADEFWFAAENELLSVLYIPIPEDIEMPDLENKEAISNGRIKLFFNVNVNK